MKLPPNLGMILLAAWLILYGCTILFGLSFNGIAQVGAILAIAAGVLLLLRK